VTASPLSIAIVILLHRGDDAAADGLRLALTAGCTFLIAGAVAGLSLVPLSIRVWRRRYWSTPRRIYFYALAVGAVVASPFAATLSFAGILVLRLAADGIVDLSGLTSR